jgi:colanic acid/amylovoran biosynthesis glycosyltransferase
MSTTVAIFKIGLLPFTQTFIPAQVSALRKFDPVYVGLDRVANGRVLESRSCVLVEHRTITSRLQKAFYKMTGMAPGFHRDIAAFKPSLLHAHFVMDGIHALRIATSLSLPLVVTIHAPLPTSFGKALPRKSFEHMIYSLRLATLWKRAAIFICVSDFIRQRALELGYPSDKLRVHYIGIDRRLFKPSDTVRDPRMVLFVGRLVERKGVRYLIEAMADVMKEVPDAHVVIIGNGPERVALERLSQDLGVNAKFLGALSDPEMREWLSRARVFAGPSMMASDGEPEALGTVFAEAQATGLPVVSCLHGGIPEVVLDGKTGLLAPERDSKAVARHVLRFLQDDIFWQACSNQAIRWIEERFDLVKQTQELEQIYSSLLK